jgi:hypothetical protein
MNIAVPPPPHLAFLSERPWQFAFGQVFKTKGDLVVAAPEIPENEVGYWRCDIARGDLLSWTGGVYRLFGLPVGYEVDRREAIARYREGSRAILERLRSFSIDNECGFFLDAKMCGNGSGANGIRILAMPLLHEGRVVGIHGLKRAL